MHAARTPMIHPRPHARALRHPRVLVLLALFASVNSACHSSASNDPIVAASVQGAPTLAEDGTPKGLHNFQRWSDHVAQGGGPEGDEAFANLARLGYRTVLSVDGARPDVELAAKYGMRYVHVPVGYDGISVADQAKIVAAVERSAGPVYVHCHHGKHRGPAAAQIARMAVDGVDNTSAVQALRESGCSPDYPGLYASVQGFLMPSSATLEAVGDLPAAIVPEGARGIMSHLDESWDFVKASEKAGWTVPAQFPDIDPAHEVGMIENGLRDLIGEEERGARRPEFLKDAREAQQAASELEAALRSQDATAASAAMKRLNASCNDCHKAFRN